MGWNQITGPRPVEESMRMYRVHPRTGCWLWLGSINPSNGYGRVRVDGKVRLAHRVAAERAGMDIRGWCVCHRCDQPRCINPDHLFLGTIADNTADSVAKGRQVRGERQHLAKLTWRQVKDMRKMADKGTTQKELAQRYGVTIANVSMILLRQTWKHI